MAGARICLGQIGAPHGVRGEVRLHSFTAEPTAIASYGPLETEDGRTLRHREGVNRGCADRPLSNGEVVAKFFDNADRAVPRRAAEHIRDAVLDFDRENARSLADALCAIS